MPVSSPLGENTYGTRDFHQMKARLFRFLVEERGFDTFALEATWPETRLLNRYLQTGEGDPHRLLSGMYFWVWRSESMLELIEWMRGLQRGGRPPGIPWFRHAVSGTGAPECPRVPAFGRSRPRGVGGGGPQLSRDLRQRPYRPVPEFALPRSDRDLPVRLRRFARGGAGTPHREPAGIRVVIGRGCLRGGAPEPAGRRSVPPDDCARAVTLGVHGREHRLDQRACRAGRRVGPLGPQLPFRAGSRRGGVFTCTRCSGTIC